MNEIGVAVFAKPPVPGRAKTRLGAAVGHEAAASMAIALLRDVWEVATAPRWSRGVLATTDVDDRSFGLGEVIRWDQGEGDLGARVETILTRGVARWGGCMALGADTAGLHPDLLHTAAQAVRRGEAVMGPSADGGFYLLAVPVCPAGVLSHLPWSQPTTFEATLARVRSQVGPVTLLPELFDVDDIDDLRRLIGAVRDGHLAAGRASRLGVRLLGPSGAGDPAV